MPQFLKQILASLIGSLAGLMLFVILGASGLVMLLFTAIAGQEKPSLKGDSVLVLDLSTNIQDSVPNPSLSEVISPEQEQSMNLRQVLQSLEQAAQDEKIVAILLDGSNGNASTTGYATLQEIRSALSALRAAGKKIIAYDVNWTEKEYYLASVADSVMLNPLGALEINGLSSENVFLSKALEKFGVGVQVIRVGKYKAAVEPFVQQTLSPENRQQTKQVLWSIWGGFLSSVGESRDLPIKQLQKIAGQRGILLPEDALASGLVDELAYFDEVSEQLKELTGNKKEAKSFNKVSLGDYAEMVGNNVSQRFSKQKIAIVYAEGNIVEGEGSVQQVGSDTFASQMRKLRQDEDVKAVVLRINSPGGSATASEIILREVQLTSKVKPVVVSMGDIAASGGYWIATGADHIFAESSTITGSIGVFGLLFNLQEIANNNGINWDVVKTSALADLNTISRPKTDQELALYQRLVERVYNQFLDKVAQSRDLSREKVAEIAQGRVWSGQDALQIGLVDQIGGMDAAINYVAQQAELGEDWQLEEHPQPSNLQLKFLTPLLSKINTQQGKNLDPLTAELLKLRSDLSVFQNLNDSRGVYTRLPFKLRID